MNKIIITQATSRLIGIILLFGGNAYAACPDPAAYPFNDCSLPDINIGSYPYFDQDVKVTYKARKKGGNKEGDFILSDFNLEAKYDNESNLSTSKFLIDLDNIFDIDNTRYRLKKVRVREGVVKSGKVTIRGEIPGLGITKKPGRKLPKLFKAKLEGGWTLSADGKLLGFNTTGKVKKKDGVKVNQGLFCHEAIALLVTCTDAESVYLALENALTDATPGETFKTDATAVTTPGETFKIDAAAVTTVPIPAAAWLFGSGLLCLAGMARKRRNTI